MIHRSGRLLGLGVGLVLCLASASAKADPPAPRRSILAPIPFTVDIGVQLGLAARVDDPPALPVAERTGAAFAVAASVTPSPLFAVGLAYERSGLGREESRGLDAGYVEVSRSLDAVWASVFVHLVSRESVRLSLLLAPGIVWQSATTNAVIGGDLGPPRPFRCSVGDSADLGLRAGLSAQFPMTTALFMSTSVMFDTMRLSSDVIDGCAPGAGTAGVFGARVGLGYSFDVTRWAR